MKTNLQPKKRKSPPHLKPAKQVVRTRIGNAFDEPLAGEKDHDYLPMSVSGASRSLDFGRPGW